MRMPFIQRSRRLGFNMTPMIDVVFLLIIFFLVSSHLAKQETQTRLALPVARSGEDDRAASAKRVTINIGDEGELTIAGRESDLAGLSERLSAARNELGEELEVRVRASRLAPWSIVQPVLVECTRQGIWNVTCAVYRQEQ